jgi:hypothetical protein
MQANLGEAIALQGQTNAAEKLGNLKVKLAEAEKNRAFKLAYSQGQEKAKEKKAQDVEFDKLFRGKENFHKLIQPELEEVLGSAFERYQKIKTSNNPYASSEFDKIIFDTQQKLSELKTVSDNYSTLTKQYQAGEKGGAFLSPNEKEIFGKFSKATSRKEFLEGVQGLEQSPNLIIDENGLVTYSAVKKIPYVKELSSAVSQLKKIPFDEQQRPLPFSNIELSKYSAIPLRVEDAEEIYNNNKKLFISGRPSSIEDIVNTYVTNNPSSVEQFAADARMPLRLNENGTFDETQLLAVKEAMLQSMKQYANVFESNKIVSDRKPAGPPEPEYISRVIVEPSVDVMGVIGDKEATATRKGYLQLGIEYGKIAKSPEIFGTNNKAVTGDLRNATLNSLKLYPVKKVDGYSRIAMDGEKLSGYELFYEVDADAMRYYVPFSKISYRDKLQGTDKDAGNLNKDVIKLIAQKNKLNAK